MFETRRMIEMRRLKNVAIFIQTKINNNNNNSNSNNNNKNESMFNDK